MSERGLFFTGERTVECRSVDVAPPAAGEVRVETAVSAISAGTELLVYRNEMPADRPLDATIDSLSDDFSYPLQYGYAAVGTVVETGPDVSETWLGRTVFAFEPHQTQFRTTVDSLIVLPETLSPAAGSLYPTVETATNLVLDSNPRLGEEVVVFGAGVIGLCTTRLLSEFPLADLAVVEPLATRREAALELGADRAIDPETAGDQLGDVDLVLELSGQPDALNDALEAVGYDGRIVVGSWYGTKRKPIDFGTRFHRNRVEIISSQVSTIDPTLRGRWDTDRRTACALEWLERLEAPQLISHRVPFEDAASAYGRLDSTPETALQVVLTYE